jgi:hypothetical protein
MIWVKCCGLRNLLGCSSSLPQGPKSFPSRCGIFGRDRAWPVEGGWKGGGTILICELGPAVAWDRAVTLASGAAN